jgi:DNA (cytosine-5)-methyltransferase 1
VKFLSVCSGIEAASSAWHPLGWKAVAFSEIEPFPCAVLAHHYPDVPNLGDMTKFKDWTDYAIDLLAGGTPCQSFSVAGLRKGLDDPRGNLMLTYGAIAARYRPRWLAWENVPGVLSSNGGRDFGTFLGMLGQLGYGFAYRVLDAQYFGVAQRRRRVFVVGCLGDWRSAAAVLFERHSLQGHPAPSRKAGKIAPTILSRSSAGGGLGTDFDCDGGTICVATGQAGAEIGADMAPTLNCNHEAPYIAGCVPFDTTQITSAANYSNPKPGDPCNPLAAGAHAPAIAFHGSQDPDVSGDVTHPVGRNQGQETCIAFQSSQSGVRLGDTHATLDANNGPRRHNGVLQAMQVRRLTPRECERLQGFPDDYTLIPWRKKPADQCPDGPRYKALGNSWAVPVASWIGERIQAVEAINAMKEAA